MKRKEKVSYPSPPVLEYAGTARLFFLFLFTALAIHALLFLLFRPLPQNRPTEKSSSQTHTILLLEDAPDYEKKLKHYRLQYALRYLEPGTAILPDLQSGFSRVLQDGGSHTLLPELVTTSSGKAGPAAPAPFVLPERPLGELARGLSRHITRRNSPAEKKSGTGKLSLPIWKFGNDRIITKWPVPDKSAEELYHSSASRVKKPTILSVRKTEKGLPPNIRVHSSCGLPALDQLAIRQTALYLGRNPSFTWEKTYLLCSVLWALPELEENEGKKK